MAVLVTPEQVWTDWAGLSLVVVGTAAALLATRAVLLAVVGWWLDR